MSLIFPPNKRPLRVGILGGGQLGRMLGQAALDWDLEVWALDADPSFPAAASCTRLVPGNFSDYDDVYQFGQQVDIVTVEIEHVNTQALHQLKAEGKHVHPDPTALDIIKDKGLQNEFYDRHQIPTAKFECFDGPEAVWDAVASGKWTLPFVQKSRKAGYDGRGVLVVREASDMEQLLEGACVLEEMVPIDKELAVIVARNPSGQTVAFPAVEMAFHPTANLVEFLSCPAAISPELEAEAEALAVKVIESFDLCGLLAVELFLTGNGELLVNEVAPRPHNSGHHTIESCYTSQYQQHLRALLDLPLGSTRLKSPAVMINLLGAPDHKGPAQYEGFQSALQLPGVFFHSYGKALTSPYRKMGHVTVIAPTLEAAVEKARKVQDLIQVTSTV